jgi:hypothetical protein
LLEPRLVGRTEDAAGRLLYLASAQAADVQSLRLEQRIGPFVAFVALDTREASGERLRDLARDLLEDGCVYVCSWGPDASRVHDVFDEVIIEAEIAGRPYVEDRLMTSWHPEQSLDDALWFAVFAAFPPEGEAPAVLAVCDPEWSEAIESRFADSRKWNEQVLAAEDEK